jgi:hypothetical protein
MNELESALQIARLTSEDLESRLEVEETARREAVIKVEQLTYELKGYKELKSKLECEVIERGKSDKEVEKLKLELKEFAFLHFFVYVSRLIKFPLQMSNLFLH